MKAQDLKNAVLQLAVQGKLVPQDPSDEPASELMKKIKAEREQLIKDKKIKREKPLPEITDDEKLFEIPDSWKWIRLGGTGSWASGATPSRTNPSYYNGNIPWLKTGDLSDGIITEIPEKITETALKETSVRLNPVSSVLIAMYGATIGKVGILGIEATTNQACCACITFTSIYNKYLFYFLLSQRENLKKLGAGGAQPNISKEKIINYLFPLPPSNEQQRIVAKIEEIMPKIDEYDKLEQEFSSLEESFPDDLKKSILQYAVQGKLVPQSPADEPTSVLLKKIEAEKEQLIKEKKIKREKPLPEITDDEKPFEIPAGWEFVRIGNILHKLTDGTHSTPKYVEKGIPFLSVKDMSTGKLDFSNVKYISEKEHQELYKRCNPEYGDILLTKIGTTGIPVIVDTKVEFSLFVSVALLKFNHKLIYNKYLYYLLSSPLVKQQSELNTKGVGNKNLVIRDITSMIVPIPPLAEQYRIVAEVERIIGLCDVLADERALAQYQPKTIECKVIPFPITIEQEDEDFPQVVGFRSNDESIGADELKELMEVADKHTK